MKYVLTTGGVISGIGKGILASSTGLLLKTMGLRVTAIKIDPYLNVDSGTMSPKEHGECYVLNDGAETDLDLGNYYRFLDGIHLTSSHSITTGKIYMSVIEKERAGNYLGQTVQVVPHVVNEIIETIERTARIPIDDSGIEPDVCCIELGGTVGDIESGPFIEAMRSLRRKAGKNNFLQTHVSLIPIVGDEQKTKPTQQAIRDVRSAGLFPDLVACRCFEPLQQSTIQKVANYCQVELEQVLAVKNTLSVYHVPELLRSQGLVKVLREILRLDELNIPQSLQEAGDKAWRDWQVLVQPQGSMLEHVKIALVGKYVSLHDSYLSVVKALEHSAMHCEVKLDLVWIDAEHLEQGMQTQDPKAYYTAMKDLSTAAGIIIPGGFGRRGIRGMIEAAKYARVNKIPVFGICLGLQLMVVEYARSVCGISDASSTEFDEETESPLILIMEDYETKMKGGTMRLGLRATQFQPGTETWSKLRAMYGTENETINERHRHRYEVNPSYINTLEDAGLHFVGKDLEGKRMEIIELPDHPWYVGVQYHPEYLSRVLKPSAPFLGFVASAAGKLREVMEKYVSGDSGVPAKAKSRPMKEQF